MPNRILHDVAAGRLTQEQGRVEAALYTLANDNFVVTVRLDEFARRIGWQHTNDYLSRVLGALRAKRRVAYLTRPGQKRPRYEIQLLYDSPPLTNSAPEHRPRRSAATDPSSANDDSERAKGNQRNADTIMSEQPKPLEPTTDPSREDPSPNREAATILAPEPNLETPNVEGVRAPKDLLQKPQALTNEELGVHRSTSRTRTRAMKVDSSLPTDTKSDVSWRESAKRAESLQRKREQELSRLLIEEFDAIEVPQ